ncbi:MAG: hypothetical protein EBS99_03520 [Betaproteobacteria bacterium]|nr:hypothetical protein [Betaproteobacteria bacterium]
MRPASRLTPAHRRSDSARATTSRIAVTETSPPGHFVVRLARSGRDIAVTSGQSVLDALRDHGVEVPASCHQGVCGSCLTRVLQGEPEHWDMYLTPEEQQANDRFTPCCSRSKTALLVIDL